MIRLQDITVAYGPRVILNHINLDIHDGETLGILGASGSGKSTILRLIIGLQKPSGGQVFFYRFPGQDIIELIEDEMDQARTHMGALAFQHSASGLTL